MVDKLKKMFKVVFLILLLQFCVIWASPEVEIQQGKLKGQFKTSVKDTQFMSFTGIPYAVPPIGNLRFEVFILNIDLNNYNNSKWLNKLMQLNHNY